MRRRWGLSSWIRPSLCFVCSWEWSQSMPLKLRLAWLPPVILVMESSDQHGGQTHTLCWCGGRRSDDLGFGSKSTSTWYVTEQVLLHLWVSASSAVGWARSIPAPGRNGKCASGILSACSPAIAQEVLAACAAPLGGFWLHGRENSSEDSFNNEGLCHSVIDQGQFRGAGFRSSAELSRI